MGSVCLGATLLSKVRLFPSSKASSPRDQVDSSLSIMTIHIEIERRTLHLTPKLAAIATLTSSRSTLHRRGLLGTGDGRTDFVVDQDGSIGCGGS